MHLLDQNLTSEAEHVGEIIHGCLVTKSNHRIEARREVQSQKRCNILIATKTLILKTHVILHTESAEVLHHPTKDCIDVVLLVIVELQNLTGGNIHQTVKEHKNVFTLLNGVVIGECLDPNRTVMEILHRSSGVGNRQKTTNHRLDIRILQEHLLVCLDKAMTGNLEIQILLEICIIEVLYQTDDVIDFQIAHCPIPAVRKIEQHDGNFLTEDEDVINGNIKLRPVYILTGVLASNDLIRLNAITLHADRHQRLQSNSVIRSIGRFINELINHIIALATDIEESILILNRNQHLLLDDLLMDLRFIRVPAIIFLDSNLNVYCQATTTIIVDELIVVTILLALLLLTLEDVIVNVDRRFVVVPFEAQNLDVLDDLQRTPNILDILDQRKISFFCHQRPIKFFLKVGHVFSNIFEHLWLPPEKIMG